MARRWTPARLSAVAAGGALGAALRWAILAGWPVGPGFPWPVLAINCAGSLVLGMLLAEEWTHPRARLLLHDAGAIGLCGGLTTFSTYAVAVVDLLERHQVATALAYTLASVAGAVTAAVGGGHLSATHTGTPAAGRGMITAAAFIIFAAAGALARAELGRRGTDHRSVGHPRGERVRGVPARRTPWHRPANGDRARRGRPRRLHHILQLRRRRCRAR